MYIKNTKIAESSMKTDYQQTILRFNGTTNEIFKAIEFALAKTNASSETKDHTDDRKRDINRTSILTDSLESYDGITAPLLNREKKEGFALLIRYKLPFRPLVNLII
mgnify:CR=1 FL=1